MTVIMIVMMTMITPPDSVLVDIVQEPNTRLLATIDVLLSIVRLGNLQMS